MSVKRKKRPSNKKLPIRGNRLRNKRVAPAEGVRYIEMKQRIGRMPKLNEALIFECVELILEGLPINRTCDYLGITQDSFYDWKHKGEKWLREVQLGAEPEFPEHEMHGLFVQCVVRAHADWILQLNRRSMQTDSKHSAMWVRDMTLLERRDRGNYSRSESIAATDVVPLPDEAYL